jgi:menaquinone-specific isochorismate synthase
MPSWQRRRGAEERGRHHPFTPATEGHPPLHINYPMPYNTWAEKINDIRHQIHTTPLKKVVLSRVAELRFPDRVDVDGALAYLHQHYNDCYRFLFEPRPFHAFYGATPELLAKVDGRTLTSMALAGSIRRSTDPLQDEALGQQLLNSAKDRHEHELVVYSILERLAPVTDKLEIAPQPGVYKLHNIQHLYTPVRANLIKADGILPIAELLHPTPAMGGTPRRLAISVIRDAEPVTRGWYAAPVGWIDVNLDGAFAVAIRSAVAQERRAWLYAGSGIVADSEPQKEWEETALKFRPMLEALGVEMVNG